MVKMICRDSSQKWRRKDLSDAERLEFSHWWVSQRMVPKQENRQQTEDVWRKIPCKCQGSEVSIRRLHGDLEDNANHWLQPMYQNAIAERTPL